MMVLRQMLAAVVCLAIGSLNILAQSSRTLIRAGHLLDVKTGKVLDAQTIIVSGDTITSIAASSSVAAQAQDNVIDLSHMTVMPGLIDVHTHITMEPNFDPYFELTNTDAKEAINGVVNARTTLMAGFTTIRNVGASGYTALQSATINAADLLGWSSKTGSIEPGHWADIIAVESNPLDDVRVLQHVNFVMKSGVVYKNEMSK